MVIPCRMQGIGGYGGRGRLWGSLGALRKPSSRWRRVSQQHARAAPLHHLLDLFAHRRCVAVDIAVGAGGFVAVAITAATLALMGEIPQLATMAAMGILMMVLAVEADHGADRLLLAHESGMVTRLFADCGV